LHGVTTPDDVRMIARSLIAFSFGLMGFVMIKVLVPGFFARQDTKTPVRAAVVGVFVNLFLGILLFTPLGHVGLAIALSAAAWVQAAALFYMLRARGTLHLEPGWLRLSRQVGLASAAMVGLLWWGVPGLNEWMNADTGQRILWLVGWVFAGVGVYFLVIFAQGVRPKDLILRQDVFE
ncbi:MAG: lipid II flippase MurJ, partial [Saprospiraceae bacterium]|nr:lipid II flippase MurJ [Saprospiraceae bacterium]